MHTTSSNSELSEITTHQKTHLDTNSINKKVVTKILTYPVQDSSTPTTCPTPSNIHIPTSIHTYFHLHSPKTDLDYMWDNNILSTSYFPKKVEKRNYYRRP